MPNRPTRRTTLLLGLTLAAAPATALAATRYAPHADAATGGVTATGLDDPAKKEIAMQLVSSAENSSLDWKAQYKYIEDIGDGRGYTAGIIGFCSGTGDMLELVELLHRPQAGQRPGRSTCRPCARSNGSDSHAGPRTRTSPGDWKTAAKDPAFQQRAGRRARPRLLQPGGAAGQGRRPAARSASSSTTTRSSCTAPATTPPASAASARRAPDEGQAAGAGRRRDDLPQRLPRRPRVAR